MCCCNCFGHEGTHPRSVPRGVWARWKEGRAGSAPKVAVLCRAVNKKWVTFEGGVQERVWRGSERETQEGVHKQVQDEVREKDAVREDDDRKCLDVKTQIWNSEADQKRRRLLELLARVHPSCLEVEVTIWNLQAEQTTTSSSRELTESATKEKYEVASSEHSRSTRTKRWGISQSPRTPQPQPQRQKRQSMIQLLDTQEWKL
jgi:hypothetical protein